MVPDFKKLVYIKHTALETINYKKKINKYINSTGYVIYYTFK